MRLKAILSISVSNQLVVLGQVPSSKGGHVSHNTPALDCGTL